MVGWTELFAAGPRRPNILFIMVDDQSPYDLRIYEEKSALQTPVKTVSTVLRSGKRRTAERQQVTESLDLGEIYNEWATLDSNQ